jgi:hypothetical protein
MSDQRRQAVTRFRGPNRTRLSALAATIALAAAGPEEKDHADRS